MKKFNKNFIAFTLSEMMIVLLLVSVISAATIPAITSRDEVKAGQMASGSGPVNFSSNWFYDSTFTRGYYFQNSNPSVRIGGSTINLRIGSAPLMLQRESGLRIREGRSDIAFFDKEKRLTGKISTDSSGSIAIGQYSMVGGSTIDSTGGNLAIGTYASALNTFGYANTVIGAYAGAYDHTVSFTNLSNILIGSDIKNAQTIRNNVVIGSNAAANMSNAEEYVGIGYYSAYNGCANFNVVNIGAYAAANPVAGNIRSQSAVNIGAYTDYASYPNGIAFLGNSSVKDEFGVVNIGGWAGADNSASSSTLQKGNGLSVVNIGAFAGYKTVRGGNVNIGYYAGSNNKANNAAIGDYNINIGRYAGSSLSTSTSQLAVKNINIGTYAGYHSRGNYSNNIGRFAGFDSTNVLTSSIGEYAGSNASATKSVFIGHYAGYRASGEDNVFISSMENVDSGRTTISGKRNVFIGCVHDKTPLNSSPDDRFCIGGKIPFSGTLSGTGSAGNKVVWNTSATSSTKYTRQMLFIPGSGVKAASSTGFPYTSIYLYAKYVASPYSSMFKFSDRRLKENLKQTKYGIDKLRNIIIYQYNLIGNSEPAIGVIAQELKKFYPYAVNVIPEEIKKGGYYSVNADWIIYSLAQSIKDVDKFSIEADKNLNEIVSKLYDLSKKTDCIKSRLDKISLSQKTSKKQLDEIDRMIYKMEHK